MLQLLTGLTLHGQFQNAARGDLPIVDQQDLECSRLAGLESRLMKLEVHAERLEGFTHVVRELRLELERSNVLEMISRIGPGRCARQIDEVQHACILPMRAPELRFSREEIRVERDALF